jgi:N-acetylmuramoyl-L-alanine amidase
MDVMSEVLKEVVLDPGHFEFRNQGVSKQYWESVAVLKLCRMIRDKLNPMGLVHVSLTRDDEKDISLSRRGKIAAERNAYLFISNHTDACGTSSVKGTTVFHSVDLPGDKVWAEEFSSKISKALETTNRGAKVRESEIHKDEDYYGVIDSAQDNLVPHVFIIESGFHTNVEDEAKLRQDEWIEKIANAQCEVILKLCGFGDKEIPVVEPAMPVPAVNPITPNYNQIPFSRRTLTIQQNLNRLGFKGKNGLRLAEDGKNGENTDFAIRRFQRIMGLEIDGKVGPKTQAAFDEIFSKPYDSQPSPHHEYATRYIQWRVGAKITGSYGWETARVVAIWQGQYGLKQDGETGPITWRKLIC